ncbi:hypothetical protein BGZ63DRAFT_399576 [Mariannaea sp. PMI_226]|nr:hypothetical protein BGZ63DRAFT_399576 [Mariannaea sp. PMI_226]
MTWHSSDQVVEEFERVMAATPGATEVAGFMFAMLPPRENRKRPPLMPNQGQRPSGLLRNRRSLFAPSPPTRESFEVNLDEGLHSTTPRPPNVVPAPVPPVSATVCPGCGANNHSLNMCIKVRPDGTLGGCVICNTIEHDTSGCPQYRAITDVDARYQLVVRGRAHMPALAEIPWYNIMLQAYLHVPNALAPEGYPWSPQFGAVVHINHAMRAEIRARLDGNASVRTPDHSWEGDLVLKHWNSRNAPSHLHQQTTPAPATQPEDLTAQEPPPTRQ